jgi:lipopolysaccharide transport system ATP-binding protein
MPLLPVGDYSISVAIAEGTQDRHIQHHWFHDALVFRSHASVICHGLTGGQMQKIELTVIEE